MAFAEREMRPPAGIRVRRETGDGRVVEIAAVRSRPRNGRGGVPVLVVPGGPGVASVLPYRGFRKLAARRGLEVLMVEHRGVGLSRTDTAGVDLAVEEVTVENAADDLAAVLDAAGIGRAVVYGASYGSYLAQVFGVRHPGRVAGMVLDSPLLAADDVEAVRAHRRRLLWEGPGRTAALVRALVGSGEVSVEAAGHVVQVVYEFAGPDVLERLLAARSRGRALRTWRWIAGLGDAEVDGPGMRCMVEPELVAGIAYGQLGYGAAPDGLPLDPEALFAEAARRGPAFTGHPVDMPAELPGFHWPTAVVSGDRDLRTPRPVAERVAGLLPDGVLVPLPCSGHSMLDTHQLAALHVAHAVGAGAHRRLPRLAPRLAALPRRGASGKLGPLVTAALTLELAVPASPASR